MWCALACARVCRHSIPDANVFLGWEELAAKDKLADAVVSLQPHRFLHWRPHCVVGAVIRRSRFR